MIRRTTALLVFVLTACCAAGVAAQDDAARAQAREQFNLGVSRYEAESYQAALEAFQEAYRLAPHPNVRVNMANCYEHLDRPLEALHHFERFLAESEQPSPQQRREVQAAIRRLEGQLGSVRLAVAPDGALVTIDSAETRRAPVLEPIRLTAGTHHVTVRLDGYRTQSQEITVAGGEEQRVAIRLERGDDAPAEVAAADPGPVEDEPAGGPVDEPVTTEDAAVGSADDAEPLPPSDDGGWQLRLTTPVIIAGSATGAFAIAMAVTGGLAVAYNADYEGAVARFEDGSLGPAQRAQARQDGLAAADTANTLSIVSDVFLIATIAAAGATAFFVIVGGMEGDEDTMASGEGFELRAAPAVGREGGGVTMQGRF